MTPRISSSVLFVAILFCGTPAAAQEPAPPSHCVAVPLPSLRGAEGDTTELAKALREMVTGFLTGPSMRVVPLDARLPQLALEEARQKSCATVLTLTLTRKRSGGGGLGRVLGSAASTASWYVPYHGAATVAARTAAAAAADIAANTRAKDEWSLEYRLVPAEGAKTLRQGTEKKKADSDGEDVVTPLVEKMATAVVEVIAK